MAKYWQNRPIREFQLNSSRCVNGLALKCSRMVNLRFRISTLPGELETIRRSRIDCAETGNDCGAIPARRAP